MAEEAKIFAARRHEFGKGSARQLRRDGKVPAVVYGRGRTPSHIAFDAHEIFLLIKGKANAVINVDVEGKPLYALVKDVQRHPIKRTIEHIDLLRVTEEDKVEVSVPVVLEGESFSGTIATVDILELDVLAPVIAIPEHIIVNVEGKKAGEHISIADIEFPPNVTCEMDPEAIVVGISLPTVEAVSAPAEGEEAAGDEAKGEAESTEE